MCIRDRAGGPRGRRTAAGGRNPGRAGELRLRAHLRLPGRPERRLRVAVAGPQVRPASRRRDQGRHPAAAGGRAAAAEVQPAGAGGLHQRPGPGRGEEPPRVPQADPALPERATAPRDRAAQPDRPDHRPGDARRQGPARADRLAAEGRQDDGAAGDRQRDHHEQPGMPPDGRPRRRASGRGHRHAALGQG